MKAEHIGFFHMDQIMLNKKVAVCMCVAHGKGSLVVNPQDPVGKTLFFFLSHLLKSVKWSLATLFLIIGLCPEVSVWGKI